MAIFNEYDEELEQTAGVQTPTSGNPYLDDILAEQDRKAKVPGPTPPSPVHPVRPSDPPKAPVNPYLQDILDERAGVAGRLGFQLGQAPDMALSHAKFILETARQQGVPADLVARNPDLYETRTPAEDARRLMRDAPSLSEWLAQQNEVTTAALKTDLGAMSGIEKLVSNLGRDAFAAGIGMGEGLWGTIRAAAEFTPAAINNLYRVADIFKPGSRMDVEGNDQPFSRRSDGRSAIPRSGLARYAELEATLAGFTREMVQPDTSQMGWFERGLHSSAQSIAQMVALAPLGPAGVLTGFGVVTGGQSYQEAREQGVEPLAATAYGAGQGAIEVLTELLPVKYAVDMLKGSKPFIQSMARIYASDIPGEQIATALQDLNTWATIESNQGKTFGDYLAERPGRQFETLVASVLTSTIMGGGASLASKIIKDAGTLAESSTTVSELPAVAVEALTKSFEKSPLKEGLIDVTAWDAFFQGKGLDPAAMALKVTGTTTAYEQAQETHEPLTVPMAGYLTHVASKPELRSLGESMRFRRPDGSVTATAKEEVAIADTLFQKDEPAVEGAGTAARPVAESATPAARPIFDAAVQLFAGVKFVPPKVAEQYATFLEQGFTEMARPLGLNPVALYESYGLKITSDLRSGLERAAARGEFTPAEKQTLFQKVKKLFKTAQPQPWEMTRERYVAGQVTGFIPSNAYERYGTREGLSWLNPDNFQEVVRTVDVKGKSVSIRRDTRPMKYTKTDANGIIVRDENGLATYLSNAEAEAEGLPLESADLVAVDADGVVGFAANEFGTTGVWVVNEMQRGGLGKALLKEFHRLNPRLAEKPMGQATSAGRNLVASHHRALVEAALREGKPVPVDVLADYSAPNDPNILYQDPTDPRASFQMSPDRTQTLISLFTKSDRSSFLHEASHLFLEVYADIAGKIAAIETATQTPAQARQLQGFQTVLKWSGYDGTLTEWAALDADAKRPFHEKFAEAFESYLRTGKAPSQQLQGAFTHFRLWLLSMAKRLWTSVEFSPEVRDIVGRMLASDEAIQAVVTEDGLGTQYTSAEEMGVSQAAFEKYQATGRRAVENAHGALMAIHMDEIAREETQDWKDRKNAIRKVVETEVYADPVYIAKAAIEQGTTPKGETLPGGRMLLDGLNGAAIADSLGFPTVAALQMAIQNAEPMRRKIARLTRERMLSEHGSLMINPAALRDQARAAIVNEDAETVGREELRALQKQARAQAVESAQGREPKPEQGTLLPALFAGLPSENFYRDEAEKRLNRTVYGDLHPQKHWTTARKASLESATAAAAGDFQTALAAKHRELLNLALFKQAMVLQREMGKLPQSWKKLFRADDQIAKSREMTFVLLARALVAPLIESAKQESITAALETLKRYDPQMEEFITDTLGATPGTTPMRQRTVDEIQAIAASVDSLWDTARREGQIEINGKLVRRDTATAALKAELAAGHGDGSFKDIGLAGLPSRGEKWHRMALGAKAWGRRVESWVSAMDGGPSGPFRTYLWTPVKERINAFRVQKVETLKAYKALLDPIQETLTTTKLEAAELGYTFGKDGSGGLAELLGAMLHIGNRTGPTSNKAKLLVGRGWGTIDSKDVLNSTRWDAMIDRFIAQGVLTKAHFDYLQGVWDLFESLKPGLQQSHRTVYGSYFQEVKADAIETPWGTYRGGYAPAIADPIMSTEAKINTEKQMTFETGTSFALPSAGRRSTIARVRVFAPLATNLAFIPSHLDWVLRFTHLQPAVKDVQRIVTDRSFRGALDQTDPSAASDMLMPWLMRAATQRITEKGKSTDMDRIWTAIRKRTGMQVLSGNVSNALQQLTGALIASVKVKPRYLANAAWRFFTAPREMSQVILDESPFMATFITSQAMEILQEVEDITLNPSKYGKAAAFTRHHNQILTSTSQNFVNRIAWLAARDQAEAEGVHGKEAIARADSVVRETQGSFFAEDVSRFEANTPAVRMLSMFSSYFNMLANLQTTEIGNALRTDKGLHARVGRAGAVAFVGFMLPAAIAQAILNTLRDDWDDDDDDTHIDELLNLLFGSTVRTAFSIVPILGPVAQAGYGAVFTDQTYDDDIRVSPTANMVGSAVKDLAGHTSKKQVVGDVLNIGGLVLNLPLGALKRPLGFLIDVDEGRAQPETAYDWARGLVSGSAGGR